MMPEEDDDSTTHARAERHKEHKAARKLECQRQRRATKKASRERDLLAKSRNVEMQQRETKEATARNTQQAGWQQHHRAREQAAQHHENTNQHKAEERQLQAERESNRKNSARKLPMWVQKADLHDMEIIHMASSTC